VVLVAMFFLLLVTVVLLELLLLFLVALLGVFFAEVGYFVVMELELLMDLLY
jgi:hypothetical protein